MHKPAASGKPAPSQMLAVCVFTWVVEEWDRVVVSDAVGHLDLPPMSDKAAPSVPTALLGVVFDFLGVDLDAKGDWNLSGIPLPGVIDIRSSL